MDALNDKGKEERRSLSCKMMSNQCRYFQVAQYNQNRVLLTNLDLLIKNGLEKYTKIHGIGNLYPGS